MPHLGGKITSVSRLNQFAKAVKMLSPDPSSFGKSIPQKTQTIDVESTSNTTPILASELKPDSVIRKEITPSDCLMNWDEL